MHRVWTSTVTRRVSRLLWVFKLDEHSTPFSQFPPFPFVSHPTAARGVHFLVSSSMFLSLASMPQPDIDAQALGKLARELPECPNRRDGTWRRPSVSSSFVFVITDSVMEPTFITRRHHTGPT